jgi:hypothetical protein
MKKITAPVPGLNGPGVGGLQFVDSVAVTDVEAVIAYCESAGYTVEDVDDDNEVGDAIRDAAVDPRPGDHLPPVNAGVADPHGPEVVSTEVDGQTPPITVPDVPAGNASREDWAAYALAIGATADEIDGLGRDEIRDQFGNREQA